MSGLVEYMPAEALINRRALLLCNLKPAKMRNVESSAMVMAASNDEHTKVELLTPPEGCAIGERVSFAGFEGEPLAPSSKSGWEAVRKAAHPNPWPSPEPRPCIPTPYPNPTPTPTPTPNPNPSQVRKAWEAVQPELSTSKERVACYRTTPFGTAHGVCTVATIAEGKIK